MDQELEEAIKVLALHSQRPIEEVREVATKARTVSEEALEAYDTLKSIFRFASRTAEKHSDFNAVVRAWHVVLNR